MEERVEVAGGEVRLVAGTRTVDSAHVDQIWKLVWAFPADPLFHGEETYYVAFLPDRVWVIPYFTGNVARFLEAVAPSLTRQSGLHLGPIGARRRGVGLVRARSVAPARPGLTLNSCLSPDLDPPSKIRTKVRTSATTARVAVRRWATL
jgi:hypothetical protein